MCFFRVGIFLLILGMGFFVVLCGCCMVEGWKGVCCDVGGGGNGVGGGWGEVVVVVMVL